MNIGNGKIPLPKIPSWNTVKNMLEAFGDGEKNLASSSYDFVQSVWSVIKVTPCGSVVQGFGILLPVAPTGMPLSHV